MNTDLSTGPVGTNFKQRGLRKPQVMRPAAVQGGIGDGDGTGPRHAGKGTHRRGAASGCEVREEMGRALSELEQELEQELACGNGNQIRRRELRTEDGEIMSVSGECRGAARVASQVLARGAVPVRARRGRGGALPENHACRGGVVHKTDIIYQKPTSERSKSIRTVKSVSFQCSDGFEYRNGFR
jgi:hypothetical protein